MISIKTRSYLKAALKEDIGSGDVTSRFLIPKQSKGEASIYSKESGVFFGVEVARFLLREVDSSLKMSFFVKDGQSFRKSKKLMVLRGSIQSILRLERTLLNCLGHLSGIASKTQSFVRKVKAYKTSILDTRKTTPLWRELEKSAVRAGGGKNHRFGLYDFMLVKENHRKFGDLKRLTQKAGRFEIEVRNQRELESALKLNPKIVLFDNFKPQKLKRAVKFARQANSKILLEASGGITLQNVASYAACGVDRISVGALTHSVRAIDLSLLISS